MNSRSFNSKVPLKPLDNIELYTLSPLSYPLINNAPDAKAKGFKLYIPFSS